MELNKRLNHRAWRLAEKCRSLAEEIKIKSYDDLSGAKILDFGVDTPGTIEAGISLALICLADLAEVEVVRPHSDELPLLQVQVRTDHPLSACIAGQYAGWPLSHEKYFAMCSGPARVCRGKEELLTTYNLAASEEQAVGILETNTLPNRSVIESFADECGVTPENVTLCIARTASIPGTLQVVARSIETTLHKLHELSFDLSTVHSAFGSAPLPPIPTDDLTALGWTNDAILYGAHTHLWVESSDEVIEAIGTKIPSNHSSDFGIPFQQIFEKYERDFYKIDKMLFSPAKVVIHNLNSGRVFQFGEIRNDILSSAFGLS